MVDESALLDLKHLLMEAQQRVPPVLMALEDPDEEMDEVWYMVWCGMGRCVRACAVCGWRCRCRGLRADMLPCHAEGIFHSCAAMSMAVRCWCFLSAKR